ncbi:nosL [Caudoviricetes sp.]|nr:nosL [Caudoviricetes sp.]
MKTTKSAWAVIIGGDLVKEYKSRASAEKFVREFGGEIEELAPLTETKKGWMD